MAKKTEIEFELNETIVYSHRDERFKSFCTPCGALVEMAAPQLAGIVGHISEREIFRLVETGDVHFVETDRVFICLRSLTERASEPPAASAG